MRAGGMVVAGLCLALAATAQAKVKKSGAQDGMWSERPLLRAPRHAPNLAPLVKATWPAVVSITTTQPARSTSAADALAAVADAPAPQSFEKGLGSGFVIRSDGYILTNAHVITGARDIRVAIDDGHPQTLPAEVVGVDTASDVALLRVHAGRPLRALPLGDSDRIDVGQWVVAQGNPFGLSHTVSVGIISYIGRSDVVPEGHEGFRDYLQTDTAINPGSSGGPLVDLSGRVVGVVNAVNPTGQGIAFALPINMVKVVLPALWQRGELRRAWLGIQVQDLTPELAESFGLGDESGVLVSDLDESGPAAKAGLRPGDVVLRFNGHAVRHAQHLAWLAATAPTQRPVTVEVRREGARVALHLQARPMPALDPTKGGVDQLGARFLPLEVPDARAAGLPLPNGVRVAALLNEGPALAAGLHVGDVITRVGATDVATPDDLTRALHEGATRPVPLVVHRGNQVLQLQLAPVVR